MEIVNVISIAWV